MSQLFSPWSLGRLNLANRIVVAPMCEYSAVDGTPGDWHMAHLGQLAMSGAGLLIIEATGVSAVGRITPGCLGLYSDANEAGLARVLAMMRRIAPAMPIATQIAMQLAHAGRKASSRAPWHGGQKIPLGEVGVPTMAVGLITETAQAEAIIASGQADAIALARGLLYNSCWPWHAAAALGAQVSVPPQYWRSQPRELKDLFQSASVGQR